MSKSKAIKKWNVYYKRNGSKTLCNLLIDAASAELAEKIAMATLEAKGFKLYIILRIEESQGFYI